MKDTSLPQCNDARLLAHIDQAVQDKYLTTGYMQTTTPEITTVINSLMEPQNERVDAAKRQIASRNGIQVSDIRICTPTPGVGEFPWKQSGYFTTVITRSGSGYDVDVDGLGIPNNQSVTFNGP